MPEKFARIRYFDGEDGTEERYEFQLWDDETESWGMSSAYPLRHCDLEVTNNRPSPEAEFISFRALTELAHLFDLGYDVNILGVPAKHS